jgi:hypothetical protein
VFPDVCSSLFRISATHGNGTIAATGFVIAQYTRPGKLAFALATAEHVFRPLRSYENIHWRLDQFDWLGRPTGWITFKSNLELLGNSPIRANLVTDVGLLFAPPVDFPLHSMRVMPSDQAVKPGGRVGWAGFPAFIEKRTGDIRPCYFEGVISSVVDRIVAEGKLYYLVDGHGGRGVSGGPVWHWNDDQGNYEVLGLCSQYHRPESPGEPGLIVVEAINPVVAYLETSGELTLNLAVD